MPATKNIPVIALCLSMFIFSCRTIRPTTPALPDHPIPGVIQPVSNIDIPVKADLKSYIKQAETSVPNQFSGSNQPCEGLRYAFYLNRSPFEITGHANSVNLNFIAGYGIDITYCAKCANIPFLGLQCVVPKVSASCGVNGEPARRIDIHYQSNLSVLPSYRLNSSTLLTPAPSPIDACNVTIANLNVADLLVSYATPPLNNLGVKVDEKVGSVDFRPQAVIFWNEISKEIKLGDLGFLMIHPLSVRASAFDFTGGSILNFSFGLSAKPVISSQSNPPSLFLLPELTSYQPASGFNINLDMFANYDSLSKKINEQVAGQVIKIGHKRFVIVNAKLSGIGNQQIVLAVEFKGCRKGTVYLTGTPTYNSITKELTLPDLAFDIQTRDLLLKIAKWIFNKKIETVLESKAKYDLSNLLLNTKNKLQTQLNRNLENNIKIEGEVKSLDIQGIYPTKENLLIRSQSNGSLKVIVGN